MAIFTKQGDKLTELIEQPYDAEGVLQQLLADHPNLLVSEQDGDERKRWLLVQREIGVADAPDGGNRWSLDHLFLDEDGVPTLVEVKRSSDTRIRREVVGQMLDYAANAARFWDVDTISTARPVQKATPPSPIAACWLSWSARHPLRIPASLFLAN